MRHMPEVELSKALWRFVIIAALLIGIGCCVGCIPEHQKKGNEVNRVFSGMVESDERVPPYLRETAKPVRKMNETLVEKHGRPNCVVNEKNVAEKAGEVEEETKAYVNPLGGWLASIFGYGTGNSLWDTILTALLGYLGVKKLGNPIRKALHAVNHVKEKKEEA